MHRLAVTAALVLLSSGCVDEGAPSFPPPDRFYYPTAVHHAPGGEGGEGTLFVANGNWDGRYDFGSVMAVDVAALGLPPVGTEAPAEPVVITDLGLDRATDVAMIDSFSGGDFGVVPLPSGGLRLMLPTRGERDRLEVIDADVPGASGRLRCFAPSEDDPTICDSPSLSAAEDRGEGHPRAVNPTDIAVDPVTGQTFVTHRFAATDPLGTPNDPTSYLVQVNAANPEEGSEVFHAIGPSGSNAVAIGERYAYVVGAVSNQNNTDPLLRLVDLTDTSRVLDANLEFNVDPFDGRDVAISSDGTRLYITTRLPDLLIVVQLVNPTSDFPRLVVINQLLLPAFPNQLEVLSRPGRGDLVAITCEEADAVVLYDADLGNIVTEVNTFGSKPFAIASVPEGAGARLFITNFLDGQIGVLDVPDLNVPSDVRYMARLGRPQGCLITGSEKDCAGEN